MPVVTWFAEGFDKIIVVEIVLWEEMLKILDFSLVIVERTTGATSRIEFQCQINYNKEAKVMFRSPH